MAFAGDLRLPQRAIALALGFDTWRTLVHEHGLSEEQATSLAMWLTCDAK
jgi:hypothetical protein